MASPPAPKGRLADKVAIVTGSSSDIGRGIALAYIREGAKVVCADMIPEARHETTTTLDLIEKEGGADASLFVKCDVSNAKEVEDLAKQAVTRFGRLDILVNNAGIVPPRSPLHETSKEVWDKIMAVNARGTFLASKYAICQMLKQEPHSSGDRGWIINIASVAGLVGCPETPAYSTSKGAIVQMTRQAALDYAPHRIHCNAICPGYVQTPLLIEAFKRMGDQSESLGRLHPFGGLGKVEDIAGPAVFLASADAQWITGVPLAVDGGYTVH